MSSEKAERNIKLFHDLVNFSRLGVIHGRVAEPKRRLEDDRLRPISESIGIDITHCFLSNDLDCGLDNSEFIKCCESLATKVDALYIKSQPGFNASTLPTLLDICNSHNVATFSPVSEAHVKSGLLMSTIGRGAYKRAGWGVTQQIVKILSDRPVELLSRDAGDDIDIAINIHTANQIGVYLPAHVIAAADEIYDQAHPDYFFDE
jgi:ABC-type uncharacterized transport system substrate-binding protein